MKVNVIEGKSRFKGTVEISSNEIILKLKKETIKISFSKISSFEDSLTTATEDDFLTGLSFRVKFSGRNLAVMILDKKETEDSFTEFINKIKNKLKLKENDYNQYLGSYYTNIPNAARFLFVIIGLIILGINLFSYKKDPTGTIVSLVIFMIFLFIAIISKRRKIVTVTENEITRHLLFREDKTVKYSQITKFTKKNNNYNGNHSVSYTLLYNGNKKIYFEYGLIDKSNQLVKFLKNKLRNVPQRDITGKKEKEWAKNRSY
jgi:hypothetical protein